MPGSRHAHATKLLAMQLTITRVLPVTVHTKYAGVCHYLLLGPSKLLHDLKLMDPLHSPPPTPPRDTALFISIHVQPASGQ